MTHLDGNAAAGLLSEMFVAEVTLVQRRCQSCGQRSAVGAHRAYTSAGTVLRCPHCEDVAVTIVTRPDGHVVALRGTWFLQRSGAEGV